MGKSLFRLLAVGFVISILPAIVFGQAGSALKLYEEALLVESGERDLKKAISIYKKVITFTGEPGIKVRAYLRTGICHERLGNTKEAKKALNKVLSSYSRFKEEVAQAQLVIKKIEEEERERQEKLRKEKEEKERLRLAEEKEREYEQKVREAEEGVFKDMNIGVYGGVAYIQGDLSGDVGESPAAGIEFDYNINKNISVGFSVGSNFGHSYMDEGDVVLADVAGSTVTTHTIQTTIKEHDVTVSYIAPQALYKISFGRRFRQIVGLGVGVYRIKTNSRIDTLETLVDSGVTVNIDDSSSISNTKTAYGFVLPIGWELTDRSFGVSMFVEYHFVNSEGSDNLQWITPSLRMYYRFDMADIVPEVEYEYIDVYEDEEGNEVPAPE